MEPLEIRVMYMEDWCAMYIDGKYRASGHSILLSNCLTLLEAELKNNPRTINYKGFYHDGTLEEFGHREPDNWHELSIYSGWVE